MRIRFLTSTPLDIRRGSGTYVGMAVLAEALRHLGHTVVFETPRRHLPVYTAERYLFNRSLRPDPDFDLTVGFDLDGYRIADAPGCVHVAALKGVVADEVRFERGFTRATMSLQARWELRHVHGAAQVLVTSRYSAARARELYGLAREPAIVPEPIDLVAWYNLLLENPATRSGFPVLFAGRHYRRKRVDVLLRAAALLWGRVPGLEIRIVGDGPCSAAWRGLAAELDLGETVKWLGDVSRSELAAEYNRAALFCLPSVQEGFGIVLLEAMAAGLPIVAANAGAAPEVAPHAAFAEPDNPEALAAAIEELWKSPDRRTAMGATGRTRVERFDAPLVAGLFLDAVEGSRAIETPA